MSLNFTQIYEGWKNNLFPASDMKEHIQAVSDFRMGICNECEYISTKHDVPMRPDVHCTNCGCTLAAKTKCLSCSCPINKWIAVVETPDMGQEVKQATDNG